MLLGGDKQRGEVIQIVFSKGHALREIGSPIRRLLQLSRRELVVVTQPGGWSVRIDLEGELNGVC